jgi:hypothetical protein
LRLAERIENRPLFEVDGIALQTKHFLRPHASSEHDYGNVTERLATMPWLVGLESTWSGSLKSGLVIPLAALVAMMILVRPATQGFATRAAHTVGR